MLLLVIAIQLVGFYPRAGSDEYFVGAPLFEQVQIQRSNGCTLLIQAHNFAEHNIFVHNVTVNGQALPTPFLYHKKHLECTAEKKQVVLEFWMSKDAKEKW